MKRPMAYITAAWSGDRSKDTEQAAKYCRAAYEAGFSPLCPLLYLPLFLDDGIPEEHKAGSTSDVTCCAVPMCWSYAEPGSARRLKTTSRLLGG